MQRASRPAPIPRWFAILDQAQVEAWTEITALCRRVEAHEALLQLLALPDPPELRGRGYTTTCPRDPLRNPDTLKRDLGTAYVEWRRQDHADVSSVISVRRSPRLRMVKDA